ncbi:amino acid adenylation domain-containing protein [Pseudomonas sp. HR96]|uniref:non-ribosomal peptide synthetase n=1 Tax=Pseudomonas sp. HR96 TaxID=1027966 RepID=UPI002A759897|nr:non-ribosomal peptide synthetase [Pseudomonas sp. HR96]WPP02039.1 amino acid adenylation domain-containing protein [Pseudomonas sp. HR96]
MSKLQDALQNLTPSQRQALEAVLAKKGLAGQVNLPMPQADRSQPLALSFAQQRLWFLWQLDPDSAAYNIPGAIRIHGALDPLRLEQCMQALVQRHEALRTTFHSGENGDVQVIHPALAVGLTRVDLRDQPAALREYVQAEAQAPFDLRSGPLLRLTLLALGEQEHLLLITLHHIVADGWSVDVFLKEFCVLYDGAAGGAVPALPPLARQYADYACWQRDWLAAGEGARQLAWWREQLGAEQPLLALPHDRPRPAALSGRGANLSVQLDRPRSERLKAFAQSRGMSPFSVWLTLYSLLLQRLSGSDDLRIGVPVANRGRAEMAGVVGFFVNSLVLRTRYDSQLSFEAWLVEVNQVSQQAQAHQDLPFEQLVDALQPERSLSHNPLFQAKFNYGFDTSQLPSPQGLRLSSETVEQLGAHFDLALDIADSPTGFSGFFTYACDLFDASTVQGFARLLEQLLDAALAAPQTPLHRLAVAPIEPLTDAPAARLDPLQSWQSLLQSAPDALAVVDGHVSLSRGQLDEQASRIAGHLQRAGIGCGAVVAVALPRSASWLAALLGVLKAGAAYLPLDPSQPPQRLRQLLQASAARRLIGRDPALASSQCPLLHPDEAGPELATPAAPVPAGSPAYVIYTSGSSGQPKGVLVSHGALGQYLHGLLERLAPLPAGGMAMVSSVAADLGHTTLFAALCAGRPLYLPGDEVLRDAEAFAQFMGRHAVSVLKIVPSHLDGLLQACPDASLLPRELLILGGEASSPALLQQVRALAPQCRVMNHYGPSETTVGVLTHEWPLDAAVPVPLALGRALPGVRLQVLDADLNPVAAGVTGELYIGGGSLALGYLGQPGLSAERFVADPAGQGRRLYRSGDRVRCNRDGLLEFVGRVDDQLKIRGYRVEPGEVARVLAALPGVRQATVQVHEQQLAAWCVLAAEASLAQVQAQLREALPDYLQPVHWTLLQALPLTANGKLDRRALPAPQVQAAAKPSQPEGPVQSLLAEIWSEVLKCERVGVDDNFFTLGGDSILSLQIIARARKRGLKVLPRQLFEAQTIRALAALLDAAPTPAGGLPAIARVAERGRAPLSFAQQRLWFLWQLAPHSAAYTIAAAVRLRGQLDEPAARGAFAALLARHENLRTRFVEEQGQPWQVIDAASQVELDWQRQVLTSAEQLPERLAADAAQPFDLASGPLLRLRLYVLPGEEAVLSLALHHIIADGWSMNLLIEEFAAHYRQAVQGQAVEPAPLALQYLDYAAWQRQWLAAGEGRRQLDWWRAYLGDSQPLLELPGDFARPAVQSYRGASLAFSVPRSLAAALAARAQAHGSTPFMLLLGAFAVLLQRYSGQHDLRIGVPQANRSRVEFEGLIGLFVNTQVLRVQLHGSETFAALLARIQHDVGAAQANAELPFEHLVEALQPQRSLSHNPLFQVMCSHTRLRSQALSGLPGLQLEVLPQQERTAQFDLALNTEELADGSFKARLTYATDLFAAASVERLQQAFMLVLEQLAGGLRTPLEQLQLLRAEQAPRVESDPRGLGPDLLTALAEQVAERPEAPALSMAGQTLSYAEVERRANQMAQRLRAAGVGPEVLVGIAAERSLQLVIALLAILKAGGAYVPLDPDHPAERLAYMIEDSGLQLLLGERALLPGLAAGAGSVQVLCLEDLTPDKLARYGHTAPALRVEPQALAYVIYTSGSTGRPKGAGNSHAALANRLHWMQQAYGLGAGQRVLQKTPSSFDVSVWEFFWPLISGACLVLAPPGAHREPARLAELIAAERITTLHFVPSMLQAFIDEPRASLCSSLTQVFCSGEALALATLQQAQACLPKATFYNLYGPTEAAIDVSHWTCGQEQGRVPIGRPISNLRLYLLDDRLQAVPAGAIGELYIGGAGLARGYQHRAGLSAERFVANPFVSDGGRMYRTGDLARLRPDGAIDYLGRSDQQVKLRGLRIELGEVENCLRQCPQVQAAVVDVRLSPAGPQLVAWICGSASREALLAQLRRQLPEYMLPALFVTLPSLPLNVNGKLDRKALPAPLWQAAPAFRAPHTAVQGEIAEIWRDLLGAERVGLDDNFFALGGHSLLATQVLARIKRQLAVDLPLRVVFASDSLQDLAAEVQRTLDSAGSGDDIDSMSALLAQLEAQA